MKRPPFSLDPIEPILAENVLTLAHAYAVAQGRKRGRPLKMTTVSKYFFGDEPFFDNLAKGKCGFRITSYDDAVKRFCEEWPEGEAIPAIRNTIAPLKRKNGRA